MFAVMKMAEKVMISVCNSQTLTIVMQADAFLAALGALEKKLFADAVANSKDWFNKSKLSADQIEVLYNQMLYRPKDPETGEPRQGAAPSLRVKLDCWDGEFKQDIYDPSQNKLYPDSETSVTPVDLITKGSQVACILRCGGMYFVNGKFGVTWRLVQAVVKPKASLTASVILSWMKMRSELSRHSLTVKIKQLEILMMMMIVQCR